MRSEWLAVVIMDWKYTEIVYFASSHDTMI